GIGHANEHLPEVATLEETDQRCRRRVETVDDVLAELDAAVAYERRHLGEEGGKAIVVIADDEPFDHRALNEQRPEVRPAGILGGVVLGNHPAQRNAGATVNQLQYRSEHGAADVLEVDVDAGWTDVPQRRHQVAGLVVHAGVEAERADDV